VGGGNSFYIVYQSLQSNVAGQRGGIFLRTYNVDTNTLGSVNAVSIDNTGAGRTGSVISDNRWPYLAQLSTGRLICAYSGNSANSAGLFAKESTNGGVTWGTEFQFTLPAPFMFSNPFQLSILDMRSDGTDVFLLSRPSGDTSAGDWFLWKRTGVGTWAFCKIFDRTTVTDNYQFSEDAGESLNFKKVSSSPDKWKIAIVAQYSTTIPTPNLNQIVCLYNQLHDDTFASGDESTHWTRVVVNSATILPPDIEQPLTIRGSDDILRTIYVTSDNKVHSADSSDWGQTWTNRGFMSIPNTKGWDPTYSRTTSLNSNHEWFISTIDQNNGYFIFKNTGLAETGWSLDSSCFIDSPFLIEIFNGTGASVVLPDTKMSRLTEDTAVVGGTAIYRLWLTTLAVSGPAGPPCTVSGSVNVCPGTSTQLCGPDGNGLTYLWTLPDGSHATTRCIPASQLGTYALTVTDTATGLSTSCSAIVVRPSDCPPSPQTNPTANRIYRRGVIKVVQSEVPQPGFSSAPMESLDGPNWRGN
jgi:hypothetical protein